jgi:hypothetical protein
MIRKSLMLIAICLMSISMIHCKDLENWTSTAMGSAVPTEKEASKGLTQALSLAMETATNHLSVQDGFWGNPLVRIPFPSEAQTVKTTLERFGMGGMVSDVTLSLNRAAEKASGQAQEILIGAIEQMTFGDAMNILLGSETAATEYLRRTTTNELKTRFTPIVAESLDKVNATKYWADVMGRYNQIPFTDSVNTDLTSYVTEQALDGLFVVVAEKEKDIRQQPAQRTTALLQKVFGYAASKKPSQ